MSDTAEAIRQEAPTAGDTIAERIHLARRRAGLTQGELGDAVGVTRQTISSWELGKTLPNLAEAAEVARATESSLGWMALLGPRSRCTVGQETWGQVSLPFIPGPHPTHMMDTSPHLGN